MAIASRAHKVFEPQLPEETWEVRPRAVQGQDVGARSVARNRRVMTRVVVVLVLMVACGLFCVWARVNVVKQGYAIDALQKRITMTTEQVQRLETEVVRLKSPQRLEVFAKDGLHMVLPSSQQIVIVKEGASAPVLKKEP